MIGLSLRSGGRAAWWPDGAVFAADFVARRYMRAGISIGESAALSVTRASDAWDEGADRGLVKLAVDAPRFGREGLLMEPARQRLSLAPVDLMAESWSNESGAGATALPSEGLLVGPARIVSPGLNYARRTTGGMSLSSGGKAHFKIRYRGGSSGMLAIYMRSNTANLQSMVSGAVGALTIGTIAAGGWSGISNVMLAPNLYEFSADFTAGTTQSDWRIGLSAFSVVLGDYVDVLAAEVLAGAGPGSWILGDAAVRFTRAADVVTLAVPAGATSAMVRFANGQQQGLAVAGAPFVVPVGSLNHGLVTSIAVFGA
jgi:hypothetical protein